MIRKIALICLLIAFGACKNSAQQQEDNPETAEINQEAQASEEASNVKLEVNPVVHASMVLGWNDKTVYIDPVGEPSDYDSYDRADLILITDIHRDHLQVGLLEELVADGTKLILPQAAADSLTPMLSERALVLNNGESLSEAGIDIEAIPMYNLRSSSLRFHPKGRGNGYVLEQDGFRTYISGDTEDIPEMLALTDIDVAFISINLPYTMSEKQAAEAVAAFKPKKVYPYHYRGAAGFSNMDAFQLWVKKTQGAEDVEIVMLDWYPVAE